MLTFEQASCQGAVAIMEKLGVSPNNALIKTTAMNELTREFSYSIFLLRKFNTKSRLSMRSPRVKLAVSWFLLQVHCLSTPNSDR